MDSQRLESCGKASRGSQGDGPGMSEGDLRERLCAEFRDRGMLDTLKSHLRNQLIRELGPWERGLGPGGGRPPEGLLRTAADSLVYHHLRRCRYDYSLSVFGPESGLRGDKVLSSSDLLRLLRVNPYSDLRASLEKKESEGFPEGLLWTLLSEAVARMVQDTRDTETQTETPPMVSVEMLRHLDRRCFHTNVGVKRLAVSKEDGSGGHLEARLSAYQQQLKENLRVDMERQVQVAKEGEGTRVRAELKEQVRRENERLQREAAAQLKTQMTSLREEHHKEIEKLKTHHKNAERVVHTQRHDLLKQLDSIMKQQQDLTERRLSWEKKEREQSESIFQREQQQDVREREYDHHLKEDLLRIRSTVQQELQQRLQEADEAENRNKREGERLFGLEQSLQSQLDTAKQCITSLQEELVVSQAQLTNAAQKCDGLQKELMAAEEKLRNTNEETTQLSTECDRLQDELRVQLEMNRTLQVQDERCGQLQKTLGLRESQLCDLNLQLKTARHALEREISSNHPKGTNSAYILADAEPRIKLSKSSFNFPSHSPFITDHILATNDEEVRREDCVASKKVQRTDGPGMDGLMSRRRGSTRYPEVEPALFLLPEFLEATWSRVRALETEAEALNKQRLLVKDWNHHININWKQRDQLREWRKLNDTPKHLERQRDQDWERHVDEEEVRCTSQDSCKERTGEHTWESLGDQKRVEQPKWDVWKQSQYQYFNWHKDQDGDKSLHRESHKGLGRGTARKHQIEEICQMRERNEKWDHKWIVSSGAQYEGCEYKGDNGAKDKTGQSEMRRHLNTPWEGFQDYGDVNGRQTSMIVQEENENGQRFDSAIKKREWRRRETEDIKEMKEHERRKAKKSILEEIQVGMESEKLEEMNAWEIIEEEDNTDKKNKNVEEEHVKTYQIEDKEEDVKDVDEEMKKDRKEVEQVEAEMENRAEVEKNTVNNVEIGKIEENREKMQDEGGINEITEDEVEEDMDEEEKEKVEDGKHVVKEGIINNEKTIPEPDKEMVVVVKAEERGHRVMSEVQQSMDKYLQAELGKTPDEGGIPDDTQAAEVLEEGFLSESFSRGSASLPQDDHFW
uniref:centriole and centriolar satellite protein ofd1-like isoform X2 n=1 Tax=Myxine glutinosa TaxID=7769 RepID=UPI00358F71A2